MIIAGIFWCKQQADKALLNKLKVATHNKIVGLSHHFTTSCVDIFAGKTIHSETLGNVLLTDKCLLMGKVFNKNNTLVTRDDLIALSRQPSTTTVNAVWGNYLYINSKDKQISILRDPTGQIKLFYASLTGGNIAFSSEIEILKHLLSGSLSVNQRYLANFILSSDVIAQATPFTNITELLPGYQLELSPKKISVSLIWDPLDYYQNDKDAAPQQSAIVDSLNEVLSAWTSTLSGVFLNFSGGLDSTSILYCLNHVLGHEKEIIAINEFNPKVQSSNELAYARKIAGDIGVKLVEFDNSDYLSLSTCPVSGLKPNYLSRSLLFTDYQRAIYNMANKRQDVQFMNGQGGDHIFFTDPPIESLTDLFIEQGSSNLFIKLKELATMTRKPAYPIVKSALMKYFSYVFKSKFRPNVLKGLSNAPWLSKDLLALGKKRLTHPYFSTINKRVPPGKLYHIYAMFDGIASIRENIFYPTGVFNPLLSQPVLELALSFPTYKLFEKHHNRYPFRQSISSYFKTDSVWRKSKGETSGYFQLAFQKHKDVVTSLCMEGYLAKEKLIDKDKLYADIQDNCHGQMDNSFMLINLLALESYLNYWL